MTPIIFFGIIQKDMEILKKDIDIFKSLECGQIFRFKKLNDDSYLFVSKNEKCLIKECQDKYILQTTNDSYFYNFFNLNVDYNQILDKLRENKYIQDCLPINPTIRIFKQDPFETIISFITSANNNIPRIKGIIEKLSSTLGENKGDYFAFPTADILAKQNEEFYKNIGLGYRSSYIVDTSRKIANNEFDLNKIYDLKTNDAREYLMTLKGVGPKVADCILLFAYNRYDVFPVDTWVKKIYVNLFEKDVSVNKMRENLISTFGEYSGIAQQYLFDNIRNN